MHLRAELFRRDGIMRTSDLIAMGFERAVITRELNARLVIRPLRGWIALPDADPHLLFAVRHGAVLSCVSALRRLDVWVLNDDGLHLATRTPSTNTRAPKCTLHWGKPVRRREPFTIVDSIENALVYAATCRPYEEALAIWESALNKKIITLESLRRYPLHGRARALLSMATPFSDSGLETYVSVRLRALGLKFVAQAYLAGHRVDFLIEGWLVLQIDGSTHTGKQRDSDNILDAILIVDGHPTIRVGYRQVLGGWNGVQGVIMTLISQGRPSTLQLVP